MSSINLCNIKKTIIGNTQNRTQGWWVRSKYATSVLSAPLWHCRFDIICLRLCEFGLSFFFLSPLTNKFLFILLKNLHLFLFRFFCSSWPSLENFWEQFGSSLLDQDGAKSFEPRHKLSHQKREMGSCSGSVGWTVASETEDPRFKPHKMLYQF